MRTLQDWLSEEPFSLAMSSGFFSFFAHSGMLMALEENDLAPVSVHGSSAGSLVGGIYASGRELSEMREMLQSLRRDDFWDPGLGLGLLRGRAFEGRLRELLVAQTFSECRIPFGLTVYDVKKRGSHTIDKGDLASAIRASCSFPGLFQPTKRDGLLLSDGGIGDRPGLLSAPSGNRVFYHHIASKSPWRRKDSPSLKIPKRDGLVGLAIEGVPRVGPFALEKGEAAYHTAREATLRALEMPVKPAMHLEA